MKKIIKLSESELHNIIENAVIHVLNENDDTINYVKDNYNKLSKGNHNIYNDSTNKINSLNHKFAEKDKYMQDNPELFDNDGNIKKGGEYSKGYSDREKRLNPNMTKSERNKMANFDKQPMHKKNSLNRSIINK